MSQLAMQAVAREEDVVRAYRLLLGREPSPPEIAERTGQGLGALLADVADSVEHREFVMAPLMAGAPFVKGRFAAPPRAADAQWLEALTPGAVLGPVDRSHWRALLRRARLALQLEPAMPRPGGAAPQGSAAPAEPADVDRAFRLVFGRAPEAEAVAHFAGRPIAALVGDLFGSEEFRTGALPAAIEGRLGAEAGPLPIAGVAWLRARFGLDLPASASQAEGLAALLRSPALSSGFTQAPPPWSPEALAELLDAQAVMDARARATPRLIERLQRLSPGVEILRLQDMEPAPEGAVRFTSADPAVLFRLAEPLGQAPAAELSFALAGGRRRATGALYLDYGEGFSEATRITLTPRGRRLSKAMVIHPRRLHAIRWDPDDREGEAWVVSIGARAVEGAELESQLARLSGVELVGAAAADASRPATDAALSRLLTQRAFGHGEGGDYADWIAENEPTPLQAQRVWGEELAALSAHPRIAVLVPLYDTPAPLLRAMIESVLAQVYPHWELCLADDASPSPHVREIVEEYMAQDDRIKAVFRPKNGHISEASNSALELVTADWLALLDHDDLLTPDALLAVAGEIGRHPEARFIYSDEDKMDEAGRRFDVFFKPDYSPELLRSMNYLNHLSVHRTAAIREVGGWRRGFEGSQGYDLNLRTLERLEPSAVRHIPRVLYHWRAVAGSTALAVGEKNYAVEAGLRALDEHLALSD